MIKMDNNQIKLRDITIPAATVIPPTAILKSVRPVYVYEDGKRTEKLAGYKYDLVNPTNYTTFAIKVREDVPLITNEEIDEQGLVAVDIPVEGISITPYRAEFGYLVVSITAPSLQLKK